MRYIHKLMIIKERLRNKEINMKKNDSNEEKERYLQEIKPYMDKIHEIKIKEKDLLASLKQNPEKAAYTNLALANEMLNLAVCHLEIDTISRLQFNLKNAGYLEEGRKLLYKCVIYLEAVVTNRMDAPFSDYEDKLAQIASFEAAGRYRLVDKLRKTIALLKIAYESDSKWKWSIVELEGRFAAVAKNLLDLKKVVVNTDPRSPDYEPTVNHLRMVKELLDYTAHRYREKYEMSTNSKDDFKKGISFLGALFRIHTLLWEKDEATEVKKKQEAWTAKLDADIKSRKAR